MEADMETLTPYNLLLMMAVALFVLGLVTFITGVVILAIRAPGRDMQTLATQTTRLAQKGIAEDVAGLVGNASALLDAMQQLSRTATGVGVFLALLGVLLMGSACSIAIYVFRMRL
jgi:hypothetical protein